ncbi:hypothetical protein [Sphingomicrobium clamense]|uniref:Uncharacterized protein n=1 Tax=Sphingomicrobium clamense TaxID=2851013 RepID=A0ABS6V4T8_9SPHN|nr:hypothetical protein [Sphingomicrobium sp. B8]MBW0144558.1 hypothetical protein [Sphingomicrobium sp. B8]
MIKTISMLALASVAYASPAASQQFGPWQSPINVNDYPASGAVNTPAPEGCPILDPYTQDLFIASPRDGTIGSLDIWRATWNGDGWDTPDNLGGPINTVDAEFCPTPTRGRWLYFVRRDGGGDSDIFRAKLLPQGEISQPTRLSMQVNSNADEWSPSIYEHNGDTVLHFSSTRDGGQHDVYYSVNFGPAKKAPGLANPGIDEARPNIRRDGLEIVFDSGGDVYTSSRASVYDDWSAPVKIDIVSTPAGESRASLSWDGTMMIYGSGGDIFVATRKKVTGKTK